MEQQLTEEQRRQWRHARLVRLRTVIIAMTMSFAVAAGAVAADCFDWIPGPLTFQDVQDRTMQRAPVMRAAATVVDDADVAKAVDPAKAADAIAKLRAAKGVGDQVSAIVMDAEGATAASHLPDQAREPASTLKTLTALAAASRLDMGSTFTTRTLFVQEKTGSNTVILTGDGDMLLSAGRSDPHHVNGRAGLATLAERTADALRQRGISSVTLAYDDSLFGDVRSPADIARNNVDNLYYTPVSSMAIDGGRLRGGAVPANPDVFADYPELSQTTARDVAVRFAALLADEGIAVTNRQPAQMRSPADRTALASVRSAPLSAVMAFMLQHSDNTLAEEFGRLLALHDGKENSPQGAVQAVRDELGALGVPVEGLTMADCSGLSPGSRATVTTLVEAQRRNLAVGGAVAAAEGLSVPGLVGTAANRLDSDAASGLMRVKTGSLGEVTSMAGNISRVGGGVLAFAVIVNAPTDMAKAREAIDAFIASLAAL